MEQGERIYFRQYFTETQHYFLSRVYVKFELYNLIRDFKKNSVVRDTSKLKKEKKGSKNVVVTYENFEYFYFRNVVNQGGV